MEDDLEERTRKRKASLLKLTQAALAKRGVDISGGSHEEIGKKLEAAKKAVKKPPEPGGK